MGIDNNHSQGCNGSQAGNFHLAVDNSKDFFIFVLGKNERKGIWKWVAYCVTAIDRSGLYWEKLIKRVYVHNPEVSLFPSFRNKSISDWMFAWKTRQLIKKVFAPFHYIYKR